ncbi:hypothetical protein B9Z55_011179 [Caenorhabditis nigoni]|uniref:Mos1 transposase HTH domain-containing protein n=3 Tax=Caenorhabditis nigoni TaxID=1611254 RepID=A0A2G5UJ88_9PELO|nr:hypothetical protein B9Z55_011179 [Caenorhabditis nigoni]
MFVPTAIHIRHVLIYLFLSHTTMKDSETFLKNVYNTHAPHYNTIRNWFHRFEKDDFSLDEKDRSGRPRELDLDKLKHALQSDPFQSSRELAVTFGVHHSTVLEGLKSLGMRKLFGRFIPHHLTQANLDRRVDDSITLLTLHAGDRWLDRLITGDEKWVFYDNHHRKSQWVGEGESPQDVPKPDLHPKKVMLSVWWGVDGPIYWELLPEGKTITGDLYTTQLRNLKKAVDRSALKDKKVYYQHDNARPHVSKQVKQELMGYGWNVLPHPPYSPDLAPSDYWLFGDMTRAFEGRSFNSRGAVEAALKQYFASRPAGFYRNGIHKLRERWRHRSYVNALLTTGSVAAGGISDDRDTSEEPEEDPFTKKMKYKRRIVMSDNEDED